PATSSSPRLLLKHGTGRTGVPAGGFSRDPGPELTRKQGSGSPEPVNTFGQAKVGDPDGLLRRSLHARDCGQDGRFLCERPPSLLSGDAEIALFYIGRK